MMSPPTSKRSVLLVDDSKEHCLLTERALRHAQPSTRCVSLSSGEAAVRHLGACDGEHPRPELLLLDWRMPGRSGAEVLAWARSQPHLCGMPILVVSGTAFPEDRRRATELGADGYLLKPMSLSGYDALAQQVDDWRSRFVVAEPPTGPAASALAAVAQPLADVTLNHWERSARMLRTILRGWSPSRAVVRALAKREYVETPGDQLTADFVRLCRAQGIVPRDVLQTLPAGASLLAQQRRTVIRGLARRGWDAQELAGIFPLTPPAIRLLVRRPR